MIGPRNGGEASLTETGGHLRPASKPSASITSDAFNTGAGAPAGSLSNKDTEHALFEGEPSIEIWDQIWPARHNHELWLSRPDGTCGDAFRNDATGHSYDEEAPPEIRIVPATESDISEILTCICGLAEHHKLHGVMATEKTLRQTLFGPRPAAEVLLAFCGGECSGFALFFPTYCCRLTRTGIYLDNLYVKPQWRSAGVGDALVKRLARIAWERNCACIEWMVADWNQPAIAFYKHRGAVLLDDYTKFRLSEEGIQKLASRSETNG